MLDGASRVQISDFSGPDLLLDEEDVRSPSALAAQNVEYVEGQVRTRRGFIQQWNPAKAITAMHNWLDSQHNHLIYFSPTAPEAISRELGTSTEQVLLDSGDLGTAPVGLSCAQAGPRIYMAAYDKDGKGTAGAFVTSILTIGSSEATLTNGAFQRPFLTTELGCVTAEPTTGTITAGLHNLGLLITSRHGYVVAPSPIDSGGTFTPWTVTASGAKNLTVTVTPTIDWPDWTGASGVFTTGAQLIMSPVDNPSVYYKIPASLGGVMGVPFGSMLGITFTISLSDDLLREGEEVVEEFNKLYSVTGAPFLPHRVIEYNNRIAYLTNYTDGTGGTTGSAFVSDPYDPQSLTLAKHLLQLPGFRSVKTGFPLGGSLFLCGPSWTYAWSDNLSYPIEWAAPRLVSGQIGSPFPEGVYWNSATGWAWVADQKGLFPFNGGSFPDRPASYYSTPDWQRINWAAPANCLQIRENVERRQVMVMVPLDGATAASHLMVWDWTNGRSWDRIKYCGLWPISGFTPGALEIVKSPTTKVDEVWVGPGIAGKVLRQCYESEDFENAANPTPEELVIYYSDDGAGIDSYYKTGSMTGIQSSPLHHIGGHFRLRGNGEAQMFVESLDGARQVDLAPVVLEQKPSKMALRLYDLQSESASYRIWNGGVAGAYWVLSSIWHYFKPWLTMR